MTRGVKANGNTDAIPAARPLGVFIWILQSILAIFFFASLGAGLLDAALLAAVGLALEVVKRIGWREWRQDRRALGLVLGVALAAVSGLAAVGFSYSAIDRTMTAQDRDSASRAATASALAALDSEADALRAKLDGLEPEWVTASLRYSARLGEIAADRGKLAARLAAAPPASGASYLDALADALGVDPSALVLALLVVVALALELAVYDLTQSATAGRHCVRRASLVSRDDLALLALATVEPRAALLGYRAAAALAGLTSWQARQAFARLAAAGKIEARDGRYYRASGRLSPWGAAWARRCD